MAEFPFWHILGAGSIGGLWAARLHQAGRAPVMVLRHERLAEYQGLHIEQEGLIPVAAVSSATLTADIKRLLVCCKSTDTLAALSSMSRSIQEDTLIVLVQNGMGTYEQVCQRFPANRILCGTTTYGAFRPAPFHVVPAGEGETLIGSLDSSEHPLPSLTAEIESLNCPDFVTRYVHPILPTLWRKLAINCAINPLTVRYQCRNGELLNIPRARTEMAGICSEILAVSRALGRMEGIENLESIVTAVAHQTAANHSSMLQDVRAGRTSEIESITGYLCRIAQDCGISTPLNNALYQEVLTLQQTLPSPL